MATENPLSAKEICSIIRACASARVSQFSLGALKITFSDNAKEIATKALSNSPKVEEKAGETQLPLIPSSTTPTEQNAPGEIDVDLLNLQLAVDDPDLWEQLQMEGKLNAQS